MRSVLISLVILSSYLFSETINGYQLPPKPDPKINNSTLLGIDSNNNGVRDDVERWIYKTYKHPIERGIFMQSARAYQKVIVDPTRAKETKKYMDNYTSCLKYWMFEAIENNETFNVYMYRDIENEISEIEFDKVLVSVGRSPVTKGLGIENTGIKVTERGFVKTNEKIY